MKDAYYRTPAWQKEFWAPNTATIPNGADPIRNPYPYANAPPNPEITSMGFSRKRALAALQQANGDVPRALERLLS